MILVVFVFTSNSEFAWAIFIACAGACVFAAIENQALAVADLGEGPRGPPPYHGLKNLK